MIIVRNFLIATLIALATAGCSGGECQPCGSSADCDAGLTCAEFEGSSGSDSLCAYPDTQECSTTEYY